MDTVTVARSAAGRPANGFVGPCKEEGPTRIRPALRPWLGLLAAAMTAGPGLPAHAQAQSPWQEVFGSPANLLAGPIQATLTLAGDDIASTGTFRRRDDALDSRVELQRFQYHHELPSPSDGPLAGWQLRGVVGYSDYRAKSSVPNDAYGMRQSTALQLVSVGAKGTRSWDGGLYALGGLGLHVARYRDTTDFGSMPHADQVYVGLNDAYINTSITTASLTARIGAGVRQPLDRERRLHGFVEASLLPLYTHTISVEHSGQRFSKFSTSVHLRTGIEWTTSLSVFDRPLTIAPSYVRRQFFDHIRPMDAAGMNELSVDLLLAPTYRHQALEGLGLSFSWMKSGDWSGFRVQLKGVFG